MNPTPSTSRTSGFRLSWLDAVILIAGTVLSWWLQSQSFPLWWIVPAALWHFFLFCNVFLVWRRMELLWAIAFVFNVAAHVFFDEWDPWLLTPPWESAINGEYSDQVSIEKQSQTIFRIYSC